MLLVVEANNSRAYQMLLVYLQKSNIADLSKIENLINITLMARPLSKSFGVLMVLQVRLLLRLLVVAIWVELLPVVTLVLCLRLMAFILLLPVVDLLQRVIIQPSLVQARQQRLEGRKPLVFLRLQVEEQVLLLV